MFTSLAQRLYHNEREDYVAKLLGLEGRMLLDAAELLIGSCTF